MAYKEEEIIRNLIYLTGKTITGAALEAGIDPTNLSKYLRGHSTVSRQKIRILETMLGLDPDTRLLIPKIHHWLKKEIFSDKINISPNELVSLIKKVLPPGQIVSFRYNDKDCSDQLTYLAQYTFLVIASSGTRVVVCAPCSFIYGDTPVPPVEEIFGPDWNYKTSILKYPYEYKAVISYRPDLSVEDFDRILSISPSSDELWTGETIAAEDQLETEYDSGWTWKLLLKKAKEAGLKPEEVAKRLGLSE